MSGVRYEYKHRDLFRQRLLESGLSPASATNYESAVLNIKRKEHLIALEKWEKLMPGCPEPLEYTKTARRFKVNDCDVEEEEESSEDSSEESTEEYVHEIMAKALMGLDISKLQSTVSSLQELSLMSEDAKIKYLVEFLLNEHKQITK